MSEVYDLIERIAATTKHTEKEAILRSVVGTHLEQVVKDVFVAAYDGTINYWVKEFPQPESYDSSIILLDALELIGKLADRTYTGNEAIKCLTYWSSKISKEDAIVLDRVIKRDLRCGATDSTANKVWPGLIRQIPYQRCSSFNEKNLKKIKFPCYSQTKADGLYIDIIVNENKVVYQTRTGQKLLLNEPIRDKHLLSVADDYVLMGEALMLDENGKYMSRKEGNGILNSDDIDLSKVAFVLWDYVPVEDWEAGKCILGYTERLSALSAVLHDAPLSFRQVDTITVKSVQQIIEHFRKNVELGEEGSVVKNLNGIWKDGTSPDQVKVKIEFVCELKVVGYKEGKGRNAGRLGAWLMSSDEGLVEVNVGTGYKDKERLEMWQERDSYMDAIFAVKSNDLIQNRNNLEIWSLFLPRSIEHRKDKTVADTFERIKEQRDAFVYALEAIGK